MVLIQREPLAIVGVGCRLPGGVGSLEDLHVLLREGRSGIREVPDDRWDAASLFHPDFHKRGHLQVHRGGFLDDVANFDAAFFGISPKEALRMDPQQRLVLEVTYQAFEDAGLRLDEVAGSRTSVFVGCGSRDYAIVQAERRLIGPTTNTGSAASIVANRVSFLFDLRGPSVAVDTACSSALTAFHLACQTIWDGSAEMALAGGVNLILSPETSMGFSKGGYLSPDGECRAFSDDANGYVRSEGAGMVLIMPMAAARSAGLYVHGLIRATVLNQDGRTPGMTMPSASAQEAMLREAYARAGVEPHQVAYVEAHGTGTAVGDPLEAQAIGTVLGSGRDPGSPLWLGSIKTNVGHLEPGAGVAGLLKLLLTLRERTVFPNLHFRAPNPEIPFEDLCLRVATEPTPLPSVGPLIGGLNSFGFGGTNGHLVLEGPPAPEPKPGDTDLDDPPGPHLLLASARSEPALRSLAGALADTLRDTARSPADVSASLHRQRTAFPYRLAQVGADRAALVAGLSAYAAEASDGGPRTARVPDGQPPQPVVFVFSGQGPQWWAMGRELLADDLVFRARILEVERDLAALGWLADTGSSLTQELGRDESDSRIGETQIAQPALFALQLGLADVLRAHGVVPAATVGHSIGELAAAVVAGALSAAEATRIVFWRSRCQAQAEGSGAMAALGLPFDEATPLLEAHDGQLELAAINGPRSVAVAGDSRAVAALGERLAARDVFFRRLEVSVPFHCYLMDPVEESFRESLGRVESSPTRIPFYSTVTAGRLAGEALDADYWWRNIREPVRFAPAVAELIDAGLTCFVEIAPHPILRRGIRDALREGDRSGAVIPTLIRGEPELPALLTCVADLFLNHVPCRPVGRDASTQMRELPTYPFQRRRFWLESPAARVRRREGPPHPVVGRPRPSSESPRRFTATLRIDPVVETYLTEHLVQGLVVLPGAGQLEAAYSAARLAWPDEDPFLESFVFRLPLSLPPEGDPPEFQLEVFSDEGHFEIASRTLDAPQAWTVHTRGRLNPLDPFPSQAVDLEEIRSRITAEVADPSVFYEELAATGLVLGPPFQGVRKLWADVSTGEILSKVVPPPELEHELERYFVHPALLDSVLQASSLGSVVLGKLGLFLPHRVRRLKFHRRPGSEPLWVYSRLLRAEGADVEVDLWALDSAGQPVIEIQGFSLRLVGGSELHRPARSADSLPSAAPGGSLYELEWCQADLGDPGPSLAPEPTWLVLGSPEHTAQLETELAKAGARVSVVPVGHTPESVLSTPPAGGVAGLIHLDTLSLETHSPDAALARGPVSLTSWVNALTRSELWAAPRAGGRPQVWAVTGGTWDVDGVTTPIPWGAPLWGVSRVLRHEDPRLQTTAVDLSPQPGPAEFSALATLILEDLPPTELALRSDRLYVQRLAPANRRAPKAIDVTHRAFRARVGTTGVLDSVSLVESRRRPPAPHEVEVEVRATALNFKDVVVGMGLLDATAWEGGMTGAELGMDCAGVVTAVGSEVTALRVGDEVLGMAHNSLSSHVLADPRHMVKKHAEISFAEAASLSTVFLTAAVGLKGLARLQAGETVLIHSAAGGVGSAAVQIAHELGARVIATTSTQPKRDFLHALGVETIFNSRSAEFREHVLAATDGRGVDVVLNSLAGDALSQGIRCLAPFGRFVDIGKLDLARNRQIGLEPFLENLSYHCLDLNRWVAAFLDEATPELESIVRKTAEGTYKTAVTVYPIDRLNEALRLLAKGQHVGKVVIEIPREGTLEVTPGERELFQGDGTYVVSGGCGGVGLEVACWIAELGGGALLLLNRSGPSDPARLQALRERGVRVSAPPCDVGDPAALHTVLERARAELPPIRGVFHLAMVLDDAPLTELTPERFRAVAHPKLNGAWNLHQATRDDPLDHFVGFSSIASLLGTPGQGNYAAANAFLDALAGHRRGLGLPATTLNYGVIDGAGVVARASEARRRRILAQGVGAFDVARVLEVLEAALIEERTQRVAAQVDWSALPLPLKHDAGRTTCFSGLASGEAEAAGERSLVEELRATPAGERLDRLVGWFAEFLAQVSGELPEAIDGGASLSRLGVDSLMANQLLVWVEAQFGVTIPLVRLMQGPTVRQLAQDVIAQALPTDQGQAT